jgi:TonB family protein
MYKFLFIFLLLQVSRNIFGQTDTVYYYKEYFHSIDRDSITWYRKVHYTDKSKGPCTATDYYVSGKIKRSEGVYLENEKGVFPTGKFVNYNENGQKISEGYYSYNPNNNMGERKTGHWMEYYANASPKWEFAYDTVYENGGNNERVINYWDSTGRQIVVNGKGYYIQITTSQLANNSVVPVFFKHSYKNGRWDGIEMCYYAGTRKLYYKETYKNGKFVRGISYDQSGKKHSYTAITENPKFPGGDQALIQILQANIRYPKYEQTMDIQGKVIIRFRVEKDGKVSNIVVTKSVSKGLDEEAVRVVKLLPPFTPGYYRGDWTPTYFNLPVVFRLQ